MPLQWSKDQDLSHQDYNERVLDRVYSYVHFIHSIDLCTPFQSSVADNFSTKILQNNQHININGYFASVTR